MHVMESSWRAVCTMIDTISPGGETEEFLTFDNLSIGGLAGVSYHLMTYGLDRTF